MLGVDICEVEFIYVKVVSFEGDFWLMVEVICVGKFILLEFENLKYWEMFDCYFYLKGVKMLDEDIKIMLLVYFIFGVSEFVWIKIE